MLTTLTTAWLDRQYYTLAAVAGHIHREAEKRNHFSFMNKYFNTQCNISIDFTYLISGIYLNFRRLLCKTCDVGHYAINHGVMKLMIIG